MKVSNVGNNVAFQRLKWKFGAKMQTCNTLERIKKVDESFYNSMFDEFKKIKELPQDVFISAKSKKGEAIYKYTIVARDNKNNELANISYIEDAQWPNGICPRGMCDDPEDFTKCVKNSLDKIKEQNPELIPSSSVVDDMNALED